MAEQRTGTILIHDTSVHVWEETVDSEGLRRVLGDEVRRFRDRSWKVGRDERVHAQWPTLSKDHRQGRKRHLEMKAEIGGCHLEFKFFQNLVVENRNGGEYDFSKLDKMTSASRALRLRCLSEMLSLVRSLVEQGYQLEAKGVAGTLTAGPLVVRDLASGTFLKTPLERFNALWQASRFARDVSGWPAPKEIASCWPQRDRDGHQLTQGLVKHLREPRTGRLIRGQVFGGINGQWWLVSNDTIVSYSHNPKEFFDCEHPELEPRRVKEHAKRLKEELDKAVKGARYHRVAAIGAVLAREAARG